MPCAPEIPNALVTVGDVRLIFPGLTAVRTKDDTVVTYELTGGPEATLTVDYAKGALKLTKTKALELGEYPAGDVPTLLDVTIGDLRWRDVPVLRSNKGRSVTY